MQIRNGAGELYVNDPGNLYPGAHSFTVNTTDVYGGTTTSITVDYALITPLPVEMVSFTAQRLSEDVLLEWETSSELNNKGFEVQRSADGRDWTIIQFQPGTGTTQDIQLYSYMDTELPALSRNILYYRLRQVDFNGVFEYSKTVSVQLVAPSVVDWKVWYGQPTRSIQYQVQRAQNLQVSLFNASGHILQTFQANGNGTLPLDGLADGLYILQLSNGEKTERFKIIVY